MPGRSYTGATNYRYGYNNQEKIDEVYNVSGSYLDFDYRGYNSRLGRFMAVDPLAKKFPYWTPYQFAGNTPIEARELEGLETWHTTGDNAKSDDQPFNRDENGKGSNVGPLEPSYAESLDYDSYGLNETVPAANPVFSGEDLDRVAQTSNSNTDYNCFSHCRANASSALNDPQVKNIPWQSGNQSFFDLMVTQQKALPTDGFVMKFDEQAVEFTFNKDIPSTIRERTGGQEGVFFYGIGAASNYHTMTLAYDNRNGADNFFLLDQGTGWLNHTKMEKVNATQVTNILTSVAGTGLNYYINKDTPGWNMQTPVKVNVIQLARPETKTILHSINE